MIALLLTTLTWTTAFALLNLFGLFALQGCGTNAEEEEVAPGWDPTRSNPDPLRRIKIRGGYPITTTATEVGCADLLRFTRNCSKTVCDEETRLPLCSISCLRACTFLVWRTKCKP